VSLDSLDHYIFLQSQYDRQKENHIEKIKEKIVLNSNDKLLQYSLYLDLFEEYRSYIYDSAYVCVEKLMEISSALNDRDKIISSQVKLGFCYLSSGLFKEAFDVLTPISVSDCSTETKIDYFTCKSRFYYDLGDYNNSPEFKKQYNEIGNCIIDSAIELLPYNSSRYWATVGLKNMKSDNDRGALDAFQKMIDSKNYSEHELAIATSSLAYVLSLQNKKAESGKYLVQAAISDVKSSTKETVALRNLAQLLYEKGDISHAVLYIRQALEDASFYNARHRQLEIGAILPIIEEERINMVEKQRDKITVFFISISVLLLLLLVALFIIWKSRQRLNIAKQAIQDANDNLTEANKIKDEYIGYFFSQNSEFIEKMKALQRWVNQKVIAKQYDDLKNFPQNLDIRKEREALFERFDQIFLKLFPDFVNEFNRLLKPEERIQLKKDELLNTDLRIYALIRLGINDNEKIARFLDYSVNTVYTYKTKIKSKAYVPGEEFKHKIMEIKSI
jgi:tetratricopeptide (TPR) repeat protein